MLKIFCIAIFALCTIVVQGASNPKHNIVFIVVDDLGYGDLSCYNPSSVVKTANIDRLAAMGVKMTQAYAYPSSAISRASFLAGKFPQNIGVYNMLDAANPGMGVHYPSFLPQMQKGGYTTAWIGKWDQGWDIVNHPLNNGFDKSFCFLGSTHNYLVPNEGSHRFAGEYSNLSYVYDGFMVVDKINHLTQEFTDRAIDFVTNCKKENKPYFLTLAYNAPHTPYQVPQEFIDKYNGKKLSGEDVARYALIDHLDQNIGRLLDVLDKNTLVVFTSDNGGLHESYNGGLKGKKNTIWEGGIKVPLIASMQGAIPAKSSSESLCVITDLATTFLAQTQQGDIANMDGVDLMPYFSGEKTGDAHKHLLFVYNIQTYPYNTPAPQYAHSVALRKGDWKILIEGTKKFASLYNIADDRNEKNDVSTKHPQLLIELTDVLYDEIAKGEPANYPIVRIDHRKIGDIAKADSLRRHCLKLLNNQ